MQIEIHDGVAAVLKEEFTQFDRFLRLAEEAYNTGLFMIPQWYDWEKGGKRFFNYTQLKTQARNLERRLKRPLVLVSEIYNGWDVNFVRKASTRTLAAQLVLIASSQESNYNGNFAVINHSCKTRYSFWVRDRSILNLFIEQCRTDPAYRAALGLNP